MLENLKALVVVLALAGAILVLARSTALQFMRKSDFDRRCVVWTILTIAGFLSPSFWLYVAIAAPLLLWAGLKDTNPLALYALTLFAIPPLEIEIPTGGLLGLFDIGQAKILSFVVLLPLAWGLLHRDDTGRASRPVDLWVLAFFALQIVLVIPYEAVTNTARRTFVFFIETYLVYYAFSRGVRSPAAMRDVMAAFCLSAAVMAAIGLFESAKVWLPYAQIFESWNAVIDFTYVLRGSHLRVQASAGHSITFGYLLAMAFGFWLYLKADVASPLIRRGMLLLLIAGIALSFSRGAMLTAVAVTVIYFALNRRSAAVSVGAFLGIAATVAIFALTPIGRDLLQTLPFIGSQDQDTISYRQELARVSWHLIQQNPWFGDPNVMSNMESLRQGSDGIIDVVNAYLGVALFYGGVGLAFFVAAFVFGIRAAYRSFRSRASGSGLDYGDAGIGAGLLACMISTLVFMATAGHAALQWQLLGLLVAYASFPVAAPHARTAAPTPSPNARRTASA